MDSNTPLPSPSTAQRAPAATIPPDRPRLTDAELARLDREAAGLQRYVRRMSRAQRRRFSE